MELEDAKKLTDKLNKQTLDALMGIHKQYADSVRDIMVLFHKRCLGADEEPKLQKYIEENLIDWPYKQHKGYRSK